MTPEAKSIFSSGAPARPALSSLLMSTLTSVAALTSLVAVGLLTNQLLLIPSMAASMALIAGAPSLPLSQPRNVIGGHLISVIVGLLVGLVSHSLLAGAIAGGLALGAMLATRTSHSPAAATAVIGTLTTDRPIALLVCTVIGAVVLVAFGVIRAAITRSTYPTYWW